LGVFFFMILALGAPTPHIFGPSTYSVNLFLPNDTSMLQN
jgi:hypothetical protein